MKLKEAIKKFEKGRTSSDDYYCVYYLRPNLKAGFNSEHLDGRKIKQCGEVDVIEYKEFEGHVMNFSLSTLRMSPDRKCRAVNIKLDPDQAEIELHGLDSYPKPKKHKKKIAL